MSQAAIRAAFESRLASFAATNGYTVTWENVATNEPEGLYLRANLLPAPTRSDDLAGDHRAYRGVFQVLIVAPLGNGAGAAGAVADDLAAEFPVALRLTAGGLTVVIVQPTSAAPALQTESRYTVPVSIYYRADTL